MPNSIAGPSRSNATRSMSAAYALHFQIPRLPQPTPPSLLKRQSSSSSASSDASDATATATASDAKAPQSPRRGRSPGRGNGYSSSSSSTTSDAGPVTPRLPVVLGPIRRPPSKRPAASSVSSPVSASSLSVANLRALERPLMGTRRDTPRPRKLLEEDRMLLAHGSVPPTVPELARELNEFEASFSAPAVRVEV